MKTYVNPEVELISFSVADIMQTSNPNETTVDNLTDVFDDLGGDL